VFLWLINNCIIYSQLFDIFESISNESLEKLHAIIRSSMNMCTSVYISVGILGYIAHHDTTLTGKNTFCFINRKQ